MAAKPNSTATFVPFFGPEAFAAYAKPGQALFEKAFGSALPTDPKALADQWLKRFDDVVSVSEANTQALFKAGNVWLKGLDTLSSTIASTAKEEIETSLSTAKTILDCRTVDKLVEAQQSYAKSRYNKITDQGTKISEIIHEVANDAAKPLTERLTASVQAVKAA